MTSLRRDMTELPDLATAAGRVGPVRSRKPLYVDLLPPCNDACPAGENCQEWLRLVKEGEEESAWRQVVRDNPFPAIHGRVCYHPCENACNRKDLDAAVSIHSVERYLGDLAIERGWAIERPKNNTGFRVLIVGGGPSGLSAAYHLAKLGHDVVVFDAGEKPGGMLRYGIPEYRLPRNIIDVEVGRLVDLGIEIRSATRVDDLLAEQRKGNFDAVYVAVGAGRSKHIEIPSMDAERMVDAVDFLHGASEDSSVKTLVGRRVAIYGGGNTAMDAARTARRLGAEEAIIVYRRTEAQMPAHVEEKIEAEREGVQMNWLRTVTGSEGEDLMVEIMELDENGRAVGTGKFEKLPVDTLILAVGQDAETDFLRAIPGLRFDGDVLEVDPHTLMSDVPGIFGGGDAIPSDRTVTIAVGHGKRAARQIDAWLNRRVLEPQPRHPIVGFDDLHLWYFGNNPRNVQPELTLEERTNAFTEIVGGLTEDQASYEATRCLSCGNCIECDGCIGACPEDSVVKLGKDHRYRYDYKKCTGCASCYDQCPVHAIEMISEL